MFGDRPLPPVPAEASQPPSRNVRAAKRRRPSPDRDAPATQRTPLAASPPTDTGSGAKREPPQWSDDSQLAAGQPDRVQSPQATPINEPARCFSKRFSSRGQVVIELPFDPRLRPGGVIDVDNDIARNTRRRLIEIAAALAEHFVATTDEPT